MGSFPKNRGGGVLNNKNDHAAARCTLYFLLLDPPPPPKKKYPAVYVPGGVGREVGREVKSGLLAKRGGTRGEDERVLKGALMREGERGETVVFVL